ncbi:unnamed protein product (macronuclear) [Paramecium tetraurelia]|uniref:Nucleotidyl transferase domain-containing protein n=1 Tax=Paramecium tetraurelia TaxID=5888 RepID=A0C573_PARTE|nr:uncharacterized protein GSPATT00006439001 [Paramecium tetraurelia]CAK65940.1 unnamed protein product [Paramecium tetraurelia]|eukprot:XP_001433337.1 hypothetical protein (macronuclear) [Paramecium tetraurelia strain d4-2]
MGECTSKVQTENIANELDFNRYSTYQKLETLANDFAQNEKIDTTYNSLIQRIIAAKQEHILKLLSVMNTQEKKEFMAKIEWMDFETVDSLFYHCCKQNHMDIFKGSVKFCNNLLEKDLNLIKQRKVGLVLLCGGNSSRLPNKILNDIGFPSKKCIFQIMMERLKKIIIMAQEAADFSGFPIGILVSDQNATAFQQYIKSKKEFGFPQIHIMQQKSLPVINKHGQVMFESNLPVQAPNGAGSIFLQLSTFQKKFPSMQYIHLLGFDNLAGLPLDPIVLNLMNQTQTDVICKVIETNSTQDDRLFYQNGYFKTMETQDSSMTENPENLAKMCLNDMYVSVAFLNNLKSNHEKSMKFSQRYHVIRRGPTIQFEKHIQDIIEIANSTILYQTEDYALLVDDPKKAVIQLSNVHKRYLQLEGTQDNELVEITPYMSYSGEDLRKQENIIFPLII